MREPRFWWRKPSTVAAMLAPLGLAFGAITAARLRRRGERAGVPVLCIGNPTVGGAGKTPTALAVGRWLQASGERPFFLTRGYGGRLAGPVQVELDRHDAMAVGDEPLLLAREAPTIVAHDRPKGAAAARVLGATVIVMDDGFQNPSLAKDFSLLVVDGRRGIGNAHVFPAGPLRAPLEAQLDLADAILLIGGGDGASMFAQKRAHGRPLFRGRLAADEAVASALRTQPVLAFAGIADPEKFFATVAEAGIDARLRRAFPDHHPYGSTEARALIDRAEREGLLLLTTEKDRARLSKSERDAPAGDDALAALAARTQTLPVRLVVEGEAGLRELILERVRAAR